MTAALQRAQFRSELSIASVCRTLPTPRDPYNGIFVMRRLAAMSRVAKVSVLQPIPYFPLFRPLAVWARRSSRESSCVEVTHAPMFYFPGLLKQLDGFWLYRAIKAQLHDLWAQGLLNVVDAHFAYPDGVGALRAAREIGVPAVITIRGVEEDYLKIPSIARQIRWLLQNADGCICVSHSLRESMISAGCDSGRIRVIHNAVDRDVFRPRDMVEARSRVAVGDDVRLVVSVGNLLSVKRHDVLIKAVERMARTTDNIRLVIIGGAMHERDHPVRLRQLAAQLGVADRVMFAGRLPPEAGSDWLAAADVFALASRREGCCNAVLEALACGVPVVVTAVGDNPWFVSEGRNGFTVPPDDVAALSDGIDRALARTTWDRDRISAELSVGNWGRVAEDVIEFLSETSIAVRRGRTG